MAKETEAVQAGDQGLEVSEMTPFDVLSEYSRPEEVEWVRNGKPDSNNWLKYSPYVDARSLMYRLDQAFSGLWSENTEYMGINSKGQDMWKCTISIQIGSTTVFKCGWSDATDIEPVKGGASSAFKRAGVKWGFGRDLYNYPNVWVKVKPSGKSAYPPADVQKCFDWIVQQFCDGNLDLDQELCIDNTMKWGAASTVHVFSFRKPDKKLFTADGSSSRVNNQEIKTENKASKHKMADINKGLYNGTGKLPFKAENDIMRRWKSDDGKFHYGKYIFVKHKDTGAPVWFMLNSNQLKKFNG